MYGCIKCLDSGCIIPAQWWRSNTLEEPLTFSKSYTAGRVGPKLHTTVCMVPWMAWWKSLLSVLHHCKKQTNTAGMHESNNEMVIKKLLYQTLLFPLLFLYVCPPIIKKYLFIKKKHISETNEILLRSKAKKGSSLFSGQEVINVIKNTKRYFIQQSKNKMIVY